MVITRLRPCIVLGPSTDPARYGIYKGKFYFKVKGHEELMNLLHEDDMASAIYLALKRNAHGAYNVAGPVPELLSEIARAIGMRVITLPRFLLKALKILVRIQWRRGKNPIPPIWMYISEKGPMCVSTAKIEKELGWRPNYTTRQAFMATFESRDQPQY